MARYATVQGLYAAGLMCKPVLVTLPFVLLLLDYWPLRRLQPAALKTTAATLARLVWEKSPLFLLAGGSCLITIAAHRNLGALDEAFHVPLSFRVANALVSYVRYLGKAVFPVNLAILYPYPRGWPGWKVAFCGLLLLGVSGLAIRTLRSRPHLFVGWFWFLGVLVPFIGLIQAGEQAMADRFMYIPILGLLLLVVWGLDALVDTWPHKHRWLAGAARWQSAPAWSAPISNSDTGRTAKRCSGTPWKSPLPITPPMIVWRALWTRLASARRPWPVLPNPSAWRLASRKPNAIWEPSG